MAIEINNKKIGLEYVSISAYNIFLVEYSLANKYSFSWGILLLCNKQAVQDFSKLNGILDEMKLGIVLWEEATSINNKAVCI